VTCVTIPMKETIKEITELAQEYERKINESENIYERLELAKACLAVYECLAIAQKNIKP
jgi:hypothetical protein